MYITDSTASITVCEAWPRPASDAAQRIGTYAVANVGDAMGRLNVMSHGIHPVWSGASCHGPALPVLTREGDNLALHRALDEAVPGDVLVVNAFGATERAVFGDLMALMCLEKGIAGVVIDGAVRDRDEIARAGLPVFARGVTPAGPYKSGPGVVGRTVACGGVVCAPGDLVVADSDGVAVVPRGDEAVVLAALEQIAVKEEGLRTVLTRVAR